MTNTNKGNRVMHVKGAAAITYWPDLTVEDVAAPVLGFSYGVTNTLSPFHSGDKEAVIYSIRVQGQVLATGGTVTLKDHAGNSYMEIIGANSGVMAELDFGKDGWRLPAGFSVLIGAAAMNVTICYSAE